MDRWQRNNQLPTSADNQWQAIINNENQANGKFWYGVTTI
jgi:methylphosphotriester-DNA--protein-cysteine methyltransferase